MQNGIFTVNWANIANALLTAVVTSVIVALVSLVSTAGFNVFTADWTAIWHNMVNLGFIAGVVSLGKDFLSTNTGSLVGIGPSSTPLG